MTAAIRVLYVNDDAYMLEIAREILDITGITIREIGEPGKGARFVMAVPKGAWQIARNGA